MKWMFLIPIKIKQPEFALYLKISIWVVQLFKWFSMSLKFKGLCGFYNYATQLYSIKKRAGNALVCTWEREREVGKEGTPTPTRTPTLIIKAVLRRILKIILQYIFKSWKSYCNEAFAIVLSPSTGRIILPEIKGSQHPKAGFLQLLLNLKSLGMMGKKNIPHF